MFHIEVQTRSTISHSKDHEPLVFVQKNIPIYIQEQGREGILPRSSTQTNVSFGIFGFPQ